jgi:hypothetical protein
MGNTKICFRPWTYLPSFIEVLLVGTGRCHRLPLVNARAGRKARDLSASRLSQNLGSLVQLLLGIYYVLILTC